MKAIFFGTPAFAARILSFLAEKNISLSCIVTQPDRPRGRNQKILHSPVKETALRLYPKVPLLQPESARDPLFIEEIKKISADLFIVVGYGQILSKELLNTTPLPINIHASLLPKYRGAAPIQRCLLQGEKSTGITIMKMNEKMDEGDILLQESIPIKQETCFGALELALSTLSCKLLYHVLHNSCLPVAQNHIDATYAAKILPHDLQVDWNKPAFVIHNQIRAFSPKPGAWSYIYLPEKKRCKLLSSRVVDLQGNPGEVLSKNQQLIIGTRSNSIELLSVQVEGKKKISSTAFLHGLQHSLHF